jgi:uncharacterized protein YjbJ (UPF0337 family)
LNGNDDPPDDTQRTIGGLAGKTVGKVKEALGHAADSDELEREGRLQQAQSEAGRLPAVEEQAEAPREREGALARADEARRLGDVATQVKQERRGS